MRAQEVENHLKRAHLIFPSWKFRTLVESLSVVSFKVIGYLLSSLYEDMMQASHPTWPSDWKDADTDRDEREDDDAAHISIEDSNGE
jgi:hypothetical protein